MNLKECQPRPKRTEPKLKKISYRMAMEEIIFLNGCFFLQQRISCISIITFLIKDYNDTELK